VNSSWGPVPETVDQRRFDIVPKTSSRDVKGRRQTSQNVDAGTAVRSDARLRAWAGFTVDKSILNDPAQFKRVFRTPQGKDRLGDVPFDGRHGRTTQTSRPLRIFRDLQSSWKEHWKTASLVERRNVQTKTDQDVKHGDFA